jgi:hypothetical protein
MSKTPKGCTLCNLIMIGILFIILIIAVFELILPYVKSDKYYLGECHISKVVYPTELPVGENGGDAWTTCDCGRRCTSWTPCVTLYTNISGIGEVPMGDDFYSQENTCTFFESRCPDGEDYRIINTHLENSLQLNLQYFNKTIDCYISEEDGDVYLQMDFPMDTAIFLSVFGGLFLLILITCYILDYRENKEKTETTEINTASEIHNASYDETSIYGV